MLRRDPYGDILVIVVRKAGAKPRRRHMKCTFGPLRRRFRSLSMAQRFASKLPSDLSIQSVTLGERSAVVLLKLVTGLRELEAQTKGAKA